MDYLLWIYELKSNFFKIICRLNKDTEFYYINNLLQIKPIGIPIMYKSIGIYWPL